MPRGKRKDPAEQSAEEPAELAGRQACAPAKATADTEPQETVTGSSEEPAGTEGRKQSATQSVGQAKAAKRKAKVDPVEFWGDPQLLPEPPSRIEPAGDITALVSSLGRVPISAGRQTAAEHWLKLVYERAGVLAGVLAAAGGLSPEPDDDSGPEA